MIDAIFECVVCEKVITDLGSKSFSPGTPVPQQKQLASHCVISIRIKRLSLTKYDPGKGLDWIWNFCLSSHLCQLWLICD